MPTFIARKGLDLVCFFEPDKSVQPAAEAFLQLNYEGYFFCNAEERDRFLMDPVTYCGMLTDPVSKRRFHPSTESPLVEHEGVLYLFESPVTVEWFTRAPGDYVLPGYEMEEMDEEEGLTGEEVAATG